MVRDGHESLIKVRGGIFGGRGDGLNQKLESVQASGRRGMQHGAQNFTGAHALFGLGAEGNFAHNYDRSYRSFGEIVFGGNVGGFAPLEECLFAFAKNVLKLADGRVNGFTTAQFHDFGFELITLASIFSKRKFRAEHGDGFF